MSVLIATPGYITGSPYNASAAAGLAIERANRTMLARPQMAPHKLVELQLDEQWGENEFSYDVNFTTVFNDSDVDDFRRRLTAGEFNMTLNKLDCLQTYLAPFGNRSDVIMISSQDILDGSPTDPLKNNSVLFAVSTGGIQVPGMYWECGSSNIFDCKNYHRWKNISDIDTWNIFGFQIDYCLASQSSLDSKCSVNYSLPIMIGEYHFVLI